jgi:hypothetical protein
MARQILLFRSIAANGGDRDVLLWLVVALCEVEAVGLWQYLVKGKRWALPSLWTSQYRL